MITIIAGVRSLFQPLKLTLSDFLGADDCSSRYDIEMIRKLYVVRQNGQNAYLNKEYIDIVDSAQRNAKPAHRCEAYQGKVNGK